MKESIFLSGTGLPEKRRHRQTQLSDTPYYIQDLKRDLDRLESKIDDILKKLEEL